MGPKASDDLLEKTVSTGGIYKKTLKTAAPFMTARGFNIRKAPQ